MDRSVSRRSSASITSHSRRKAHGFTLIEILIVLIVLGILAAIAIVQFARAKEKAFVSAMTADLHNAAVYEEMYASDNYGSYFSGTVTAASPLQSFQAWVSLRTCEDARGVASHLPRHRTLLLDSKHHHYYWL